MSAAVPSHHGRMKAPIAGLGLAAVLAALPTPGTAQVSVGASIGIDIRFPEPPPLVVVTPGVQIVPEYDEEVYFVNNYYWVRRADVWYRTSRYDGGWRPVRVVTVPPALVRIPPGRYRHYYRDDDGYWRPHDPGAYHAWRERNSWDDRRAWWHDHRRDRQVRMEQERSWREHQRREREEQKADWHRQKDDRKLERGDMHREREQQDRMRRDHERDDRERDRGGPPGHDRPHGRH